MVINDNELATGVHPPRPSCAHGRAALLLVESLIYGLCDSKALSQRDAIEVAERAVTVQREQAEAADDPAPSWHAHTLLLAITSSLRLDGDGDGPRPPRLIPAT